MNRSATCSGNWNGPADNRYVASSSLLFAFPPGKQSGPSRSSRNPVFAFLSRRQRPVWRQPIRGRGLLLCPGGTCLSGPRRACRVCSSISGTLCASPRAGQAGLAPKAGPGRGNTHLPWPSRQRRRTKCNRQKCHSCASRNPGKNNWTATFVAVTSNGEVTGGFCP